MLLFLIFIFLIFIFFCFNQWPHCAWDECIIYAFFFFGRSLLYNILILWQGWFMKENNEQIKLDKGKRRYVPLPNVFNVMYPLSNSESLIKINWIWYISHSVGSYFTKLLLCDCICNQKQKKWKNGSGGGHKQNSTIFVLLFLAFFELEA